MALTGTRNKQETDKKETGTSKTTGRKDRAGAVRAGDGERFDRKGQRAGIVEVMELLRTVTALLGRRLYPSIRTELCAQTV